MEKIRTKPVTEIRENLPDAYWRHCPGVKNPADIPSRAIDMAHPEKQKIWLEGPEFLLHDKEHWPTTEIMKELGYLAAEHFSEPINVAAVYVSSTALDGILNKKSFNSFEKLILVTCYVGSNVLCRK